MEDKNKSIMKQHPLQRRTYTVKQEFSGFSPFGLEEPNPITSVEMMGVVRESGDNLQYAREYFSIHGVCDGCSLGPRGLVTTLSKGHISV